MRTFAFTLLAFVVGLIAGFAIFVFGGFAWMDYAGVFDRDGGIAMAIFFTLGPLGGILTGIAAAVVTARFHSRKAKAVAAGTRPAPERWPLGVRAAVAGVSWAVAAFVLIQCTFWLLSPMSFATYEAALLVTWLPVTAPLAVALAAVLFVLWRKAPRAIA